MLSRVNMDAVIEKLEVKFGKKLIEEPRFLVEGKWDFKSVATEKLFIRSDSKNPEKIMFGVVLAINDGLNIYKSEECEELAKRIPPCEWKNYTVCRDLWVHDYRVLNNEDLKSRVDLKYEDCKVVYDISLPRHDRALIEWIESGSSLRGNIYEGCIYVGWVELPRRKFAKIREENDVEYLTVELPQISEDVFKILSGVENDDLEKMSREDLLKIVQSIKSIV